MDNGTDMRFLEAVMKMVWGTDEQCRRDHAEAERMLDDAERKVDRLITTLDERPPKNLQEAISEMTGQRE